MKTVMLCAMFLLAGCGKQTVTANFESIGDGMVCSMSEDRQWTVCISPHEIPDSTPLIGSTSVSATAIGSDTIGSAESSIASAAVTADSLDSALDGIEDTPTIRRLLSRRLLEDRRCYVFNDGGYECWLPGGVCAFRMPSLTTVREAKAEMVCEAYGAVEVAE